MESDTGNAKRGTDTYIQRETPTGRKRDAERATGTLNMLVETCLERGGRNRDSDCCKERNMQTEKQVLREKLQRLIESHREIW